MSRLLSPLNRIVCVGVLFSATRMLAGAFSLVYFISYGLTLSQIGMIKALQYCTVILADVPLSIYADRSQRRIFIIGAIACAAVWMFLMGIARTALEFAAAEFFNALSLALMSGIFYAYLLEQASQEEGGGKELALYATYNKFSFLVMAIVAMVGVLIFRIEGRGVWFVGAGFMAFILLLSMGLPADRGGRATVAVDPRRPVEILRSACDFLVRRGAARTYMIFGIYLGVALQVYLQYWQAMLPLGSLHAAPLLGVAFSLILIAQAGANHVVGIVHAGGRTRVALATAGASALLMISAMLGSANFVSGTIALVLAFGGLAFMGSLVGGRFVVVLPNQFRSTGTSFISLVVRVLMGVCVPLAGWMIGRLGHQSSSFMAGICAAVGAALAWALMRIDAGEDRPGIPAPGI